MDAYYISKRLKLLCINVKIIIGKLILQQISMKEGATVGTEI